MKFKAILEKFDSNLWGQHVKVPEKISQKFLAEGSKRVVVKVNKELSFQGALMPSKKGYYFINFNKQNSKKLGLEIGQSMEIELSKDESKYGLPMPEEFQELLWQDEEGNDLFHALTPGRQRNLLHIIGSVKSPDIRIRKGLIALNHLKSNGGKLDNRKLNEDFKNYKDHDFGF